MDKVIYSLKREIEKLRRENGELRNNLKQCENGYELELHTLRCKYFDVCRDLEKALCRVLEIKKEYNIL